MFFLRECDFRRAFSGGLTFKTGLNNPKNKHGIPREWWRPCLSQSVTSMAHYFLAVIVIPQWADQDDSECCDCSSELWFSTSFITIKSEMLERLIMNTWHECEQMIKAGVRCITLTRWKEILTGHLVRMKFQNWDLVCENLHLIKYFESFIRFQMSPREVGSFSSVQYKPTCFNNLVEASYILLDSSASL